MSIRTISRNGQDYWHVEVVRPQGRRRRQLAKKNHLKRDAIALEHQLIAELEHAGVREDTATPTQNPETPTPSRDHVVTFGEFADRFMSFEDASLPDYANKEAHLRVHLCPYFEGKPLAEIGPEDIEMLRAKLRATVSRRGPLSVNTRNRVLGTLRRVLNRAVELGELSAVPRVRNERQGPVQDDYLSDDEVDALVRGAGEFGLLILVAVRTGLRLGELQELRGRDVLFGSGQPTLRVTRQLRGQGKTAQVAAPKHGRYRSVPLTRAVAGELRLRGARHRELVFSNEDGTALSKRQIGAALGRLGKDLLGRHVHPHLLRHTFASHAAMSGVHMPVLQRWLGHADLKTTLRYAHLAPGAGDEMIERLDGAGRHLSVVGCEDRFTATSTATGSVAQSETPLSEG